MTRNVSTALAIVLLVARLGHRVIGSETWSSSALGGKDQVFFFVEEMVEAQRGAVFFFILTETLGSLQMPVQRD